MTGYEPLYVGGKRDKARRYINPSTGEIISRRQYIKIKEGVSPESKAYARYLAGKAPKGVTAKKRSEEHTSELQSREKLVCRLLLEKKKNIEQNNEFW